MRTMLVAATAGFLALACSSTVPMPPGPAQSQALTAAECHYTLPDQTRIYAEAEVDQPPIIRRPGSMNYPEEMKAHGIQGWVMLHYVVDASGAPIAASISVDSTSHSGFVPAARETVAGARFRAGALQGRPVPVCVKQRINWVAS